MRRLVATSLVVTVAVLIAACGGDDSAPTTTTAEPATTSASPDTGPQITIEGFDFGAPIEVSVGESITIVNSDATTHTWTASGGAFDSGPIGGGSEFEYTFESAGEYRFFCDIHPQMTGSITVSG